MTIDAAGINHLAKLAELELTEAARTHLGQDLNRIVDMIDILASVDTEGVEPLRNPLEMTQRLRADAITEGDQREALQKVAPATRDGFFIVPRVIE